MGEFQEYIMDKNKDLITKMDIVRRLQKLLKEKKGENFFFDKSVIFKTQIAKMFIDYMNINDVDRDLVLTACLVCNCKKVNNAQKIGKLHTYAKEGADYLLNIGFEPRFCRICEGVNRYSGLTNREAESDILELVDQYGGMMLDRPERQGFSSQEALIQLEKDNLKDVDNRYLDQFHNFVNMIQNVEINDDAKGEPSGILARRANADESSWSVSKYMKFLIPFNETLDRVVPNSIREEEIEGFLNKKVNNSSTELFPKGTLNRLRGQSR